VKEILNKILKVQPHKTKLAEELYISRETLYNWLGKETIPNNKAVIARLKKVAKKYGVSIEEQNNRQGIK
jgi:DNA-binding phage protein